MEIILSQKEVRGKMQEKCLDEKNIVIALKMVSQSILNLC